jgi:para-nitrobenzyl esterase
MMSLDKHVTSWSTSGIVLLALVVMRLSTVTTGLIHASAQPSSSGLAETSWHLVKFQGPDRTTLTPDDRGKYTIEFGAGQLRTRVDCNRGRGTWQSSGGNQIEFSSLSLTRVRCPDGSLHDQIVKHWTEIRSYAIKGGHLFLSVTGNGGTYEFEPAPKNK